MRNRFVTYLSTAALMAATANAGDPGTGDWPMWGGTGDRNMVSEMKDPPLEWDVASNKNVVWVADLGSQAYGNPTIGDGKVFVGTNNEALRDPNQDGDRGVLMAFRASDGMFLWQHTNEKLASGRANDWPYQGVASSPMVEGKRVWYVNNRGEVVCLDTEGFHDGENDGPYDEEELTGELNADIVWVYNMMEELGVYQHNLANSSPVSWGNYMYLTTSNGQDETHVNVPSPRAPALIALDKTTGELIWEDNSPEGKILHGQWSSPAVGEIAGVTQVIHAQGDGWVRGFVAETGEMLWEFDTNPKDAVWPKTRNSVISTPVIYQDKVFIANGQDPEHGEGIGHMYAIDATKRGDITESGRIWHFEDIRRSISTAAIKDGLLFISDFSGFFHCLNVETGEPYWTHDMLAAVWASPVIVDDKVFLGDEDGDVVILDASKEQNMVGEFNMGSSVYGSVVAADNSLFISNRNRLFRIAVSN
jgi:outer membrane protein assembly factor BamB